MLRGHLHLEAESGPDGRTRVARQSFQAPFHLGKPYWDGRALQVRVVNPTAGILAGDGLELDIRVGSGASLLVLTPAATRAFMMKGGVAECRQAFRVEAGGWLEYAPEPLFPHRETEFTQLTRLEVAEGAEAYFADALAPGRAALGEAWAWRRLILSLSVDFGAEPVLRERLDGSGAELGARAAFYGMPEAWFGTVVVLSSRIGADDPAWGRVRALHGGGRWVGASRLRRGGWVVRVVAPGGQSLRDALAELRSAFAATLPGLRSDLRKVGETAA